MRNLASHDVLTFKSRAASLGVSSVGTSGGDFSVRSGVGWTCILEVSDCLLLTALQCHDRAKGGPSLWLLFLVTLPANEKRSASTRRCGTRREALLFKPARSFALSGAVRCVPGNETTMSGLLFARQG